MNADLVLTPILCYLFEKHNQYKDLIKLVDGREITIIDSGHIEEYSNIYYNVIVEVDGLQQMVRTAIFYDSESWLNWQNGNSDVAQTIGMVVVAEEKDDIDRYSTHSLLCVKCSVPYLLHERLYEIIAADGSLCGGYLSKMDNLSSFEIFYRYAIERMEAKHDKVLSFYQETGGCMRDAFVATIFDSIEIQKKRNRKNFNTLIRNIGYDTLLKNLNTVEEVEALLFGAAGMFNRCKRHDGHTEKLLKLYLDMKRKYSILEIGGHLWDYSTISPENNLHIVFAQLAAIIINTKYILSHLDQGITLKDLYAFVSCETHTYWLTHNTLSGEETFLQSKRIMSCARKDRMVINGFVPFLFFYYKNNSDFEKSEMLLSMLENIPQEDNAIVRQWQKNGVVINNALISQAILQISKVYCKEKRCTVCMIGRKMLG
ncbi:MAG: DUF2851 family protein [Rikenellaceae bacterium]